MEILKKIKSYFVFLLVIIVVSLILYALLPIYPKVNYKIHFNNEYVDENMRIVESDFFKKCIDENSFAFFIWLSQTGNNFYYDLGADVISKENISHITLCSLNLKMNGIEKTVKIGKKIKLNKSYKIEWCNASEKLNDTFIFRLPGKKIHLRRFFKKQKMEMGKEYQIELEMTFRTDSGKTVSQRLDGFTIEPYPNTYMGKEWLYYLPGF